MTFNSCAHTRPHSLLRLVQAVYGRGAHEFRSEISRFERVVQLGILFCFNLIVRRSVGQRIYRTSLIKLDEKSLKMLGFPRDLEAKVSSKLVGSQSSSPEGK